MLFKYQKFICSCLLILCQIFTVTYAGGVVTFTPSLIPCGALGCGPLTITNATSKTIAFAGVAVSYQDPKTPLTNFLYGYTGCTNGIIAAGASCDVVINPNGFTLVPGNYPVRPLFYRTLEGDVKDLLNITFDVQTGVDCTDDSQCTVPDTCTAGSCVSAAVCGNGSTEGSEFCDSGLPAGNCSCNAACTAAPICGDGTIDTGCGEACEPPSVGGCDIYCQLIPEIKM